MPRKFESVDELTKKFILNSLHDGKTKEELEREQDVIISPVMRIVFVCEFCHTHSNVKVVTTDIPHMKKYIDCPNCGKTIYASSFQKGNSVDKRGQRAIESFFRDIY